jgi:hypothetical protein
VLDLPKKKLPIQIADVDGVHINDVNILKPRKCEVRENFAPQPSSTNDQYLTFFSKELLDLR